MAGPQDANDTISLADSAVWAPGNLSNTSSVLLSHPICLTLPLTSAATQDFPACPDGENPYLTACYVRKKNASWHDFKIGRISLLFYIFVAILNLWGKIAMLYLTLVSLQQSSRSTFKSWPGIVAPNPAWWFYSAHFQPVPVWWAHRSWPGRQQAVCLNFSFFSLSCCCEQMRAVDWPHLNMERLP